MWFTTVGLWIHWIIEECDFDSLWTWNILEFVLCKLQGDNFNHATALLIFHARQAAKFWPKIVSLSVGFAKAPGHPQGSPQFWRVKAFWPWVPGESRSGYPNWPTDPSGSRTSPPKKNSDFGGWISTQTKNTHFYQRDAPPVWKQARRRIFTMGTITTSEGRKRKELPERYWTFRCQTELRTSRWVRCDF